jgi:CheY-like chemotaxis protein
VGLGIPAAADALGLEFVSLAKERYDLVIPAVHFDSDLLAPLFDLLNDPVFRNAVERLPGYDIDSMGKIIARLEWSMLKALVIDDSEEIAENIIRMLKILGVEARMALSVREALILLLDSVPDIIFLDIRMPGFDGFEVLSYLRREPKLESVPVCIVSNDDQEEIIARSKKLGAIGYILKPASVDLLEKAIQKAALQKNES